MINVALHAAKKAGELTHKYYKTQPKIRYKADHTPVTKADVEAEKLIRDIISRNFPDHAIVGEEMDAVKSKSKYKWVIDPIDGTRYFAHHLPYWGTLIALLENDKPIIGIANLPEMNILAVAEKGKGAFINDKKIRVSNVSKLEDASVANGSLVYVEEINKVNELINLYGAARGAKFGLGSVYAYIMVANGDMDINVDPKSNLWDIAAPKIILEEAGGKFTDLKGSDSLLSGAFVGTNGLLHDQVLNLLGEK